VDFTIRDLARQFDTLGRIAGDRVKLFERRCAACQRTEHAADRGQAELREGAEGS